MPHYVALSSVKNCCDAFFYMNWKGSNYLGKKKSMLSWKILSFDSFKVI